MACSGTLRRRSCWTLAGGGHSPRGANCQRGPPLGSRARRRCGGVCTCDSSCSMQQQRNGGSDRRLRCTAARTAGARQLCISRCGCGGAVHAARESHRARRERERGRRAAAAPHRNGGGCGRRTTSRQPSAPGLHRTLRCLHAAADADQAHSAAGALCLFEALAAALDIEYREQREVMRHRGRPSPSQGCVVGGRSPDARRPHLPHSARRRGTGVGLVNSGQSTPCPASLPPLRRQRTSLAWSRMPAADA